MSSAPEVITSKIGERLKYSLIPGSLYIKYRANKELHRGEAEVSLLPFLAPRDRNAVDAGANKGVYTYFMARLCKHVYAFEPNPKIYRILQKTIAGNVTASPAALSDNTGRAVLRVPYGSRGHQNQNASLSAVKVSGNHTPVDVETYRLDDLQIENIGFMKIDVEGFELPLLAGAAKTIARDRPNLLIEMEERHTKQPIEHSLKYVLDLGYDGFFLRKGVLHPLSAFDPEADHRKPSGHYVFNFIFLPSGTFNARSALEKPPAH